MCIRDSFKFGFIGSTDTHLGTPGLVDEQVFDGHGGAGKSFRESIPEGLPDDIEFNPGGLAVVWAEENSRTSIFSALKRKEVYGTSGPRFLVRFFFVLFEHLIHFVEFLQNKK